MDSSFRCVSAKTEQTMCLKDWSKSRHDEGSIRREKKVALAQQSVDNAKAQGHANHYSKDLCD